LLKRNPRALIHTEWRRQHYKKDTWLGRVLVRNIALYFMKKLLLKIIRIASRQKAYFILLASICAISAVGRVFDHMQPLEIEMVCESNYERSD